MSDKEWDEMLEKIQKEQAEEMGYDPDKSVEELCEEFSFNAPTKETSHQESIFGKLPSGPDEICNHFYSELRTETENGKLSRAYFYCSRCLDIQIKDF